MFPRTRRFRLAIARFFALTPVQNAGGLAIGAPGISAEQYAAYRRRVG